MRLFFPLLLVLALYFLGGYLYMGRGALIGASSIYYIRRSIPIGLKAVSCDETFLKTQSTVTIKVTILQYPQG